MDLTRAEMAQEHAAAATRRRTALRVARNLPRNVVAVRDSKNPHGPALTVESRRVAGFHR